VYKVNVFGVEALLKNNPLRPKDWTYVVTIAVSMGGLQGSVNFRDYLPTVPVKRRNYNDRIMAEEFRESGPINLIVGPWSRATEWVRGAFLGYFCNLPTLWNGKLYKDFAT